MYLSLNAKKFWLKPCKAAVLKEIDTHLGVPLPIFYKRFLQVAGLGHKLDPHLISKVEDFACAKGNEQFLFATDTVSYALFLGFQDDPNQIISHEYTTDPHQGDSLYSTSQTFTEYLIQQVQKFEKSRNY